MADEEQLERLIRSVEEWDTWRQEHPDILPDLENADLSFADLSFADLNFTNLKSAKLRGAKLSDANLKSANLTNAGLGFTDLSFAHLSNANLSSANLSSANLSYAKLSDANLTEACFWHTIFTQVDLHLVEGLDTAIHRGPSCVDINSVILPQDEATRKHFLRGVGFSDIAIEYLPSILTPAIQYHSLFLSHSHYDQTFTKRLYTDLQNHGVRCWYAPHDLLPGRPIVRGIEEAIHLHEKLLLILSEHAVISSWVELEVEAALYKEATTKQEILFPIRLDNAILQSETLWAKRLRQRHIADFTSYNDDGGYQHAFNELLRHLKVNKPPTL